MSITTVCNDLQNLFLPKSNQIHYKNTIFNIQPEYFVFFFKADAHSQCQQHVKNIGTGANLPLCYITFSFNNTQ